MNAYLTLTASNESGMAVAVQRSTEWLKQTGERRSVIKGPFAARILNVVAAEPLSRGA